MLNPTSRTVAASWNGSWLVALFAFTVREAIDYDPCRSYLRYAHGVKPEHRCYTLSTPLTYKHLPVHVQSSCTNAYRAASPNKVGSTRHYHRRLIWLFLESVLSFGS